MLVMNGKRAFAQKGKKMKRSEPITSESVVNRFLATARKWLEKERRNVSHRADTDLTKLCPPRHDYCRR